MRTEVSEDRRREVEVPFLFPSPCLTPPHPSPLCQGLTSGRRGRQAGAPLIDRTITANTHSDGEADISKSNFTIHALTGRILGGKRENCPGRLPACPSVCTSVRLLRSRAQLHGTHLSVFMFARVFIYLYFFFLGSLKTEKSVYP